MSSQRRHEGYYDSHPGFPSSQKEQYRIWVPPDPHPNKPSLESADPKHSARRNGDGKYYSSIQSSRPDTHGNYFVSASTYTNPPTTSTRKTSHSTTRPPSRNATTRPSQPTSSTVQQSSTSYPQKQGRSRSQDIPEIHDLRTHLKKRSAVPTPKSSFEQISGVEDSAKNSRHTRSRSSVRSYTPAPPAPAQWNPIGNNQADSSRRHAGNEMYREEKYREKAPDRPDKQSDIEVDGYDRRQRERERPAERDRDKTRDKDRTRDRDRTREREREKYVERQEEGDKERRFQGEYRRPSRPSVPQRDLPDLRTEDHDSSDSVRQTHAAAHRRYRSDEITSSNPSRRQHPERSRYVSFALPAAQTFPSMSNAPTQAYPTTSSHPPVSTDPPGPLQGRAATPRSMPVRLPMKESKPYRPYHDKSASLPPDLPTSALSGSDTEHARRREIRHRTTNDSSRLRGNHVDLPVQVSDNKPPGSTPREQVSQSQIVSSRPPEVKVVKETRTSTSRSQRPVVSKPPDYPPDVLVPSAIRPVGTPAEKYKEKEVIPQFVSIRAGQGPSDAHASDTLSKPSAFPHLEVPANPSTSSRPQPSTVPDFSQNDSGLNQRAMTSSHNTSQTRTGPDPTIELRTAATPATQPPLPETFSQALSSRFLARPNQPPESLSRPTTRDPFQEPVVPSAPPPSRSVSHNTVSNEPYFAGPHSVGRVPPAGIFPRQNAVQTILPSLAENRHNQYDTRQSASVPTQVLSTNAAATSHPLHAPQIPSAARHPTSQTPSNPPTAQHDIHAPSLPQSTPTRVQAEPSLPVDLHFAPPLASKTQTTNGRSPHQFPVVEPSSAPRTPVVSNKVAFPSSDKKDIQPAHARVDSQDPTSTTMASQTTTAAATPGLFVLPTAHPAAEPTKQSPKVRRHDSYAKPVEPSVALQPVSNVTRFDRPLDERQEPHASDPASTSPKDVGSSVQSTPRDVATKRSPVIVPRHFVPPPQPTPTTVNTPPKIKEPSHFPVDPVGVSHANIVPPVSSDAVVKPQPTVPRHFVPPLPVVPKIVDNPKRLDLPTPNSVSTSDANTPPDTVVNSRPVVVPQHFIPPQVMPKNVEKPERPESHMPDSISPAHANTVQPTSSHSTVIPQPVVVPRHFVPPPPAIPKNADKPERPEAHKVDSVSASRTNTLQPSPSDAVNSQPAVAPRHFVPIPPVMPKIVDNPERPQVPVPDPVKVSHASTVQPTPSGAAVKVQPVAAPRHFVPPPVLPRITDNPERPGFHEPDAVKISNMQPILSDVIEKAPLAAVPRLFIPPAAMPKAADNPERSGFHTHDSVKASHADTVQPSMSDAVLNARKNPEQPQPHAPDSIKVSSASIMHPVPSGVVVKASPAVAPPHFVPPPPVMPKIVDIPERQVFPSPDPVKVSHANTVQPIPLDAAVKTRNPDQSEPHAPDSAKVSSASTVQPDSSGVVVKPRPVVVPPHFVPPPLVIPNVSNNPEQPLPHPPDSLKVPLATAIETLPSDSAVDAHPVAVSGPPPPLQTTPAIRNNPGTPKPSLLDSFSASKTNAYPLVQPAPLDTGPRLNPVVVPRHFVPPLPAFTKIVDRNLPIISEALLPTLTAAPDLKTDQSLRKIVTVDECGQANNPTTQVQISSQLAPTTVVDQVKLLDSRPSTFANISNVVGSSEVVVGINKETRAEQSAVPSVRRMTREQGKPSDTPSTVAPTILNHAEKVAGPKISASASHAIVNFPQPSHPPEEVQVGRIVVPTVESPVLKRSPRTAVEKRNPPEAPSESVPIVPACPEKVAGPKLTSSFTQSTMKPSQQLRPPVGDLVEQIVLQSPVRQRSPRAADERNKLSESPSKVVPAIHDRLEQGPGRDILASASLSTTKIPQQTRLPDEGNVKQTVPVVENANIPQRIQRNSTNHDKLSDSHPVSVSRMQNSSEMVAGPKVPVSAPQSMAKAQQIKLIEGTVVQVIENPTLQKSPRTDEREKPSEVSIAPHSRQDIGPKVAIPAQSVTNPTQHSRFPEDSHNEQIVLPVIQSPTLRRSPREASEQRKPFETPSIAMSTVHYSDAMAGPKATVDVPLDEAQVEQNVASIAERPNPQISPRFAGEQEKLFDPSSRVVPIHNRSEMAVANVAVTQNTTQQTRLFDEPRVEKHAMPILGNSSLQALRKLADDQGMSLEPPSTTTLAMHDHSERVIIPKVTVSTPEPTSKTPQQVRLSELLTSLPAHAAPPRMNLPPQSTSRTLSSSGGASGGVILEAHHPTIQKASEQARSTPGGLVPDRVERSTVPHYHVSPAQAPNAPYNQAENPDARLPNAAKYQPVVPQVSAVVKRDSEQKAESQNSFPSLLSGPKPTRGQDKTPESGSRPAANILHSSSARFPIDENALPFQPPHQPALVTNMPHDVCKDSNQLTRSSALLTATSAQLSSSNNAEVNRSRQLEEPTASSTVKEQRRLKEIGGVPTEPTASQDSNTLLHTPPSLAAIPQRTSSRLNPVSAQVETQRFTSQTPAPTSGSTLKHPPYLPISASKDIVPPLPSSTSTPTSNNRPLVHRSTSSDPRMPTFSHAQDTQPLPRTTTSTSVTTRPTSKLHRSPSFTSFPEVSTVTRRAPDPNPSDVRLQSSASQPHAPASMSRSLENSKGVHSNSQGPVERSSVTPASSASVRPPSRSREQSSRTRDNAFSTTVPNTSNVNLDRSRQSIHYSSTSTQYPYVSLASSTSAAAPVSQSQSTSSRTHPPPHVFSQSKTTSQTATSSTRTPTSGYVPPSASTKRPQLDRNISSDSENLFQPSAPIKKAPASSSAPTTQLHQDSRKKTNILGMFRGKTPQTPHREIWYPPSSTRPSERAGDPRSDARSSAKATSVSVPNATSSSAAKSKAPPPPIVVPVSVPAPAPSGRRSPSALVFTPFRFLSASKRHVTVSIASLEAVDGTASNTVVGSPTASIVSQAPWLPPMRDPIVATQEWRNKEEADLLDRPTGRRRRPGVVFDVAE